MSWPRLDLTTLNLRGEHSSYYATEPSFKNYIFANEIIFVQQQDQFQFPHIILSFMAKNITDNQAIMIDKVYNISLNHPRRYLYASQFNELSTECMIEFNDFNSPCSFKLNYLESNAFEINRYQPLFFVEHGEKYVEKYQSLKKISIILKNIDRYFIERKDVRVSFSSSVIVIYNKPRPSTEPHFLIHCKEQIFSSIPILLKNSIHLIEKLHQKRVKAFNRWLLR